MIAMAILGLVPTVVIALFVRVLSASNTRKRIPLVVAEVKRTIAANEQVIENG